MTEITSGAASEFSNLFFVRHIKTIALSLCIEPVNGALCRQAIESGGCVVLVPGLLPGANNVDGVIPVRQLSRMLGLSSQSEISDDTFPSVESLVAQSMEGEQSQTCAAAVTYRADFPQSEHRQVLRSDPAYQQIDMNNATLANPAELVLSQDECAALQETLNLHFADDGIRFESRDSARWYCHFDQVPDVITTPVSAAIGRDVAECRPTGVDARAWRSKLAEIEMLLFEHPVNTARQEQGQLPVNTLWLWGEGSLNTNARDISVVSDNFYTSCFASHHGLECVQPDNIDNLNINSGNSENTACMIVIDKLADLGTQQDGKKYNDMLHWFEQTICSALWKNLKPDGWSEIVFWCGDNRLFRLPASDKKRFWRRAWFQPQPLAAFTIDSDDSLQQEQQHQGRQ